MTRADTIKLLAILKTAYTKFYVNEDEAELDTQINLWAELLSDISFNVVEIAIKQLILQSPYPPTISDVRKKISETVNQEIQLTTAEAWGEVTKALRNYGYYRPEEALASLSTLTAKTVKQIGWKEICLAENIEVLRGQFRMMYEQIVNREKQSALLPETLKQQIRVIANNYKSNKLLEGDKN